MLCIVDDAQRLDQESPDALALVGRRLHADSIALLFAARVTGASLAGIPELRLRRLGEQAAVELGRSVSDRSVDDEVVKEVVSQSHGLPMAMVELAAHGSEDQPPAGAVVREPATVRRRLEAHLLRAVRELPAAIQTLLLVAAADSSGDWEIVTEAAAGLGVGPEEIEPARAARLLSEPDLRFRHPLIRSAVHSGTAAADRRQAHDALATVIDPVRDAERRAWHLAAATVGPSEDVADRLEAAALRAVARGGSSSAGTFWLRAAELTEDDEMRAERLLAGAEAHPLGGAPVRAQTLLPYSAPHFVNPYLRARAKRLDGMTRYALGDVGETASMLISAGRALEPFDLGLARATMLRALSAARITGRLSAPGERYRDVLVAVRSMPMPREPSVSDLLIDAHAALFSDRHATAVTLLRRALDALGTSDDESDDGQLWMASGCFTAGVIGDDEGLHALAHRLGACARGGGALVTLSYGLLFAAMSEVFEGSLTAARTHSAERSDIMSAIGRPPDVGELVWFAWAGREAEERAAAVVILREATRRSHGWILTYVEYALAVLELGLSNAAARPLPEALTGETIRLFAGTRFGTRVLVQIGLALATLSMALVADRRRRGPTPPSSSPPPLRLHQRCGVTRGVTTSPSWRSPSTGSTSSP